MPDFKGRLTDGKIFGTFLDNEANPSLDEADAGILGVAFDSTASYKKGTRLGPQAIMQASHQIEYPPTGSMERLSDLVKLHFVGILEYPEVEEHEDIDAVSKAMVAEVQSISEKILSRKKLLALLGGEHSVLNGTLKALGSIYQPADITILQIDAHLDLRKDFDGLKFSHGSIMRNALGAGFKAVQIGIRDQISGREDTGGEAEFIAKARLAGRIFYCATQPGDFYSGREKLGRWIERDNLIYDGQVNESQAKSIESLISTKYLWITIDVDGFDPAIFPGTGTPLPHGLTLPGVERLIYTLLTKQQTKLLGFDIVEVAPQMRTDARKYSPRETVSTVTEMNAALLAYKIFFWNFLQRF